MPNDGSDELVKMVIEAYTDQNFKEGQGVEEWRVLFNPSDYTLTRSNAYSTTQSAGTSRPTTAYGKGNSDQLSLTLFIDGTGVVGEPGCIYERVKRFMDLMHYQGSEHKPWYVWVRWGTLDFRGVLKSGTATFNMFNNAGEPIRARISASFEQVIAPEERENTENPQSPDLYQLWRVEEGDRLDRIAYETYGDTRYWRPLAELNELVSARNLVPGMTLVLPPLER